MSAYSAERDFSLSWADLPTYIHIEVLPSYCIPKQSAYFTDLSRATPPCLEGELGVPEDQRVPDGQEERARVQHLLPGDHRGAYHSITL
jgi:hypothetical protein